MWGLRGGLRWFTVLSLGRSLGLVRGLEGKRKDRGRVTEGKGGMILLLVVGRKMGKWLGKVLRLSRVDNR
jgi:hypothetical protein